MFYSSVCLMAIHSNLRVSKLQPLCHIWPSVFLNKVLLEKSNAHFSTYSLWLPSRYPDRIKNYYKDWRLQYLDYLLFYRKSRLSPILLYICIFKTLICMLNVKSKLNQHLHLLLNNTRFGRNQTLLLQLTPLMLTYHFLDNVIDSKIVIWNNVCFIFIFLTQILLLTVTSLFY